MIDTSALTIMIAAIFTSNILLVNFLGMCAFLACSKQMETSIGLGTAVALIAGITTTLNYLVYYFVLVPCHAEHMEFIVFIAIIAAFVQFTEIFMERFSPKLYHTLGIFLPLIITNTAIFGAALFMVIRQYNFLQTVGYGFGTGIGWALAIVLLAGLRQKMGYSNVPAPFRGAAIVLAITSVMAMAFMGFAGMVNIQ